MVGILIIKLQQSLYFDSKFASQRFVIGFFGQEKNVPVSSLLL